ncbi:hypothetical protein F2Q69_00013320 [Brassica cretica]|uniref:Uncharacterized protein n=1 Tax=Brassica cretica TaxID=69181 RepID=A0A8S9QTQ8_BRACR|nr:hypothetical protein F2Q69_00013320 [Brassica cretica]
MTDENNNINERYPTESLQKRKRNSDFLTDSEVNDTPQVRQNKSGLLPLKSVFSRVLADVTNTFQTSPTTPQSESSHITSLTGQSSQCDSSIRQSNLSSKRTCSDIRPTNLFKAFSTLDKTENVNEMEFGAINLDLFKDQGSQIYDISSEEEDTNYDNNSESETECLPQQDQNVTTVPDEQRARIKSTVSMFKSMFQDKPAKKGWSSPNALPKKNASPPKPKMGGTKETMTMRRNLEGSGHANSKIATPGSTSRHSGQKNIQHKPSKTRPDQLKSRSLQALPTIFVPNPNS